MMRWQHWLLGGACLAILWGAMPARGDLVGLASDRFGYTGTYTKYATLEDAQNGTNATGTGTVDQRDLGLSFSNNVPSVDDANYFLTAWYYSTVPGHGMGWGNPNNTDLSFIQIANPASTGQPLVGTSSAYWTSSARDEFAFTASGTNADSANSAARFGDQSTANQAASATRGIFHSYSMVATFSGLNPATLDSSIGAWVSEGDTSGMSVNGTFDALFENTSTTHPGSNGFYVIHLTLNTTSWVIDNLDNLQTSTNYWPYSESYFAASATVPEPSSLVIAMVGGSLGLFGYGWRRRRVASATAA